MSSTRQILQVFVTFCLLQWLGIAVGQITRLSNITRLTDGDVFTRISNGTDSECPTWLAIDIEPYSDNDCSTITCKCEACHNTFSSMLDRCADENEILSSFNCSGEFLPPANKPLYDFTKPGKARLNASYFNNGTDFCRISKVEFFNGTELVKVPEIGSRELNVSHVGNDSLYIFWQGRNTRDIYRGSVLILHILCNETTSSGSCVVIKTAGNVTRNKLEGELKSSLCVEHLKTSTDDMLVYILVGVGSGFVFILLVSLLFVCFRRRRSVQRTRGSTGSRRPFQPRSSNKSHEPTTPAIHDMIFNGLSWDADSGFSNRAITDSRCFEVDYGIPVDFSDSLPRPGSSVGSNRNSLSPLTDLGDSVGR